MSTKASEPSSSRRRALGSVRSQSTTTRGTYGVRSTVAEVLSGTAVTWPSARPPRLASRLTEIVAWLTNPENVVDWGSFFERAFFATPGKRGEGTVASAARWGIEVVGRRSALVAA